jgi:hypothetical protein
MSAYPHLFSEWQIRNTTMKNRGVFQPPCPTWVCDPWNGLFYRACDSLLRVARERRRLQLLALYNRGGAEKALSGLPDFQEVSAGSLPDWTRG